MDEQFGPDVIKEAAASAGTQDATVNGSGAVKDSYMPTGPDRGEPETEPSNETPGDGEDRTAALEEEVGELREELRSIARAKA